MDSSLPVIPVSLTGESTVVSDCPCISPRTVKATRLLALERLNYFRLTGYFRFILSNSSTSAEKAKCKHTQGNKLVRQRWGRRAHLACFLKGLLVLSANPSTASFCLCVFSMLVQLWSFLSHRRALCCHSRKWPSKINHDKFLQEQEFCFMILN